MTDSDNILVHDNIITGGRRGISVEGGRGSHIFRNTFTNNTLGCYLMVASLCEVTENNFVDNMRHAKFRSYQLNLWDGNYWDNAVLKFVKIIFGKRMISDYYPISVPSFTFDLHPAQEPYDIGG